jgi:hypothetical protein
LHVSAMYRSRGLCVSETKCQGDFMQHRFQLTESALSRKIGE